MSPPAPPAPRPGAGAPVLHVAEEMAPLAGGVPAVVRQLGRRLALAGHPVTVLHARGTADDMRDCATVVAVPPQGPGRVWADSPQLGPALGSALAAQAAAGGVLHVHGVWSAPQMRGLAEARRRCVPAVFTAHGMLEPWLWDRQGWRVKLKKTLFWRALAAARLGSCRIVHAITPMERDQLHRLLPGNRIEIVPNAIELPDGPRPPEGERRPTVLFLGRLEPKKGVDLLVRAFAAAALPAPWQLEIVGPAWSEAYLAELQALVAACGLTGRAHLRGPLFGAEKARMLDQAWVLATPSHSEVVGLVNLEAAAHWLPSVTTHPTGLWDWEEGGGLLIAPEVAPLTAALRRAAAWGAAERAERGERSRALVQRRYSWAAVLPLWQALYADLAQRSN